MNAIQDFFLRAKHWHIFVLLFAIPEAVGFVAFGVMQKMLFIVVGIAVTIVFMLGLLAWYWSVGSFSLSGLKPQFRMKPGLFHFAVLYLFGYTRDITPAFCRSMILPIILSVVAVQRFWASYRFFAFEFAKSAWRDFAACAGSEKSEPPLPLWLKEEF